MNFKINLCDLFGFCQNLPFFPFFHCTFEPLKLEVERRHKFKRGVHINQPIGVNNAKKVFVQKPRPVALEGVRVEIRQKVAKSSIPSKWGSGLRSQREKPKFCSD